uniref:Beta-retroviral matrix protein domain-containing protein n=1 Tax=Oryctolagus cuniculus TaxID=9986 RepID=A0A5F9CA04_RABIT
MGNTPSVAKMRLLFNRLLRATGTPGKAATVCSFTRAVVKVLPWFIEGGDLSRENWRTVGRELHAAKVEETVLRMWYLVDNALATDSETIGQLLDEGLKILEKIGKDSKDSSSKDLEEESGAGGGMPSKKSIPPSDISPPLYPPLPSVPPYPEDSPHCCCLASSAPQWSPVVLGSGRTAVKEKGRAMTPVDPEEEERDSPVGRGIQSHRGPIPDWSQFYKPQQIFPVFIDQQGNRGWTPVDFKLLKELQQAVQLYGTHANFTKAVLEGMGSGGLIVEDWRNIVKAVLSGGDSLLWAAAYGELAKKQALANRANRQPAWNEDMCRSPSSWRNDTKPCLGFISESRHHYVTPPLRGGTTQDPALFFCLLGPPRVCCWFFPGWLLVLPRLATVPSTSVEGRFPLPHSPLPRRSDTPPAGSLGGCTGVPLRCSP